MTKPEYIFAQNRYYQAIMLTFLTSSVAVNADKSFYLNKYDLLLAPSFTVVVFLKEKLFLFLNCEQRLVWTWTSSKCNSYTLFRCNVENYQKTEGKEIMQTQAHTHRHPDTIPTTTTTLYTTIHIGTEIILRGAPINTTWHERGMRHDTKSKWEWRIKARG